MGHRWASERRQFPSLIYLYSIAENGTDGSALTAYRHPLWRHRVARQTLGTVFLSRNR